MTSLISAFPCSLLHEAVQETHMRVRQFSRRVETPGWYTIRFAFPHGDELPDHFQTKSMDEKRIFRAIGKALSPPNLNTASKARIKAIVVAAFSGQLVADYCMGAKACLVALYVSRRHGSEAAKVILQKHYWDVLKFIIPTELAAYSAVIILTLHCALRLL